MIIEHDGIVRTGEQELIVKPNVKATIFSSAKEVTAKTEKNAELILVTLNDAKTNAILEGDNSRIKTINLYKGDKTKIEINARSEHIGKNTISLIRTVGVMSESESITKGLIRINESAENSDGYQKSEVLILKESKATTVPDLEIHNDKVKCTHGATITRIDPEKLFYLQSRGLDRGEAEEIIISGFYESALREIDDEGIKDELREALR